MEPQFTPPAASLTAAGICHNLDVGGHPSAGEPTVDTGVPAERVTLGYLETGQPVSLVFRSLEQMGEAAAAITAGQGKLALFLPREVHPFGDDTSGAAA
jgi:hypothetical protein